MSETEQLKEKVKSLEAVVSGLERILKLNEKEIANAEEIIEMYEQIAEFSRMERLDAQQAQSATEVAGQMSAEELKASFARIQKLEEENKKLREESGRLKS